MSSKKAIFLQPEWILAGLITIIAISLHFYYWLHIGGLWRDEVNLVNLSGRHSLAEMEKDSFPLLTPLAFHVWMAVGMGESDLKLRLFGLLVGLGILAALWISSWKIRRTPPLWGLVLLGLNSTLFFFGDSLRAYGLGSLLAMALTTSAFVFLQQPSGWRAGWLALFAILSVQVLYHNAVLVAAICFGAWAVCWRRKDGRAAVQILLVAVLSAASLLPYAHNLMSSGDASLRTGVDLSRFFRNYKDTLGFPRGYYIYVWAALYVAMVVCTCVGFAKKTEAPTKTDDSSRHDLSLFAANMLTFAVIGFHLFFLRAQMPMESWYLLPFMAAAAICFDATLTCFKGMLRVIPLIFVVITAWFSVPETDAILKAHFSDVNLYAHQLEAEAAPKDYIVVEPWLFGITFDHYFKGPTPWDTLPPLSDHSSHRFDLVQLQMQNTNAITPVLERIAETLQSGHRVWILSFKGWFGVPPYGAKPPATLAPAPLPDTGWADWPYSHVWAAQVACFTGGHSSQFVQLKGLSSERYITEDMDLFVAEGWHTNSAGHNSK